MKAQPKEVETLSLDKRPKAGDVVRLRYDGKTYEVNAVYPTAVGWEAVLRNMYDKTKTVTVSMEW
ncbi:hypothetical protein EPA3_135 [Pseudomonas phage vB_PaM_EPA3]|nr:hypothetical protein EPA3_135 [Pseudomonas phage vB_PaM_EPA3]